MKYKLIKKGSFTFKREGKFKTSYLVRFRQGGIYLVEKILQAKDDRDAINIARRMISEAQKRARFIAQDKKFEQDMPSLIRWETIFDEVIETKAWPPTRKTVEYYLKKCVLPVLEANQCAYCSDFGETTSEDFVKWYQKARPGERLFNPRKYFLQAIKRARRRKLIPADIEIKIPNPDPKSNAGKVYSDAEIKRLFDHAEGDLALQLLMAFTMGMRKSEILKLQWDRINWDRQTIALRPMDTKIRQGREFKVNAVVWAELEARYLNKRGPFLFSLKSTPFRPTSSNKTAWKLCQRKAGVTGRFHDIRHTFLTHEVSRKKHQALDVCIYAGLSMEELRRTYLHPTFEDTAYLADSQVIRIEGLLGSSLAKKMANKKLRGRNVRENQGMF